MWGELISILVAPIGLLKEFWAKDAPKKPLTRDNLTLPRTEEGSVVPLVVGRARVMSPILAYTSNLYSVNVDNSNNGGAYNVYGLDMLFVAGLPMGNGVTRGNSLAGPKLHAAWMGDQKLPSPGALPQASNGFYNAQGIFRPEMLGGPGAGGGLIGSYQWFGGWTDQDFTSPASPIGDSMVAKVGSGNVPGLRKMLCVGFSYYPADSSNPYWNQTIPDGGSGTHSAVPIPGGFVLGESSSVNGFSFECSSYGDKVFSMVNPGLDYSGDADPIEVIYDLLTNKWGRIGLDTSKIDNSSFAAASATLKTEGHGFSQVLYQNETGASIIARILKQIDCALFEEPSTGTLHVKLIRGDYNPATIPAFDVDSIDSVDEYAITAWRDTVNEVRVNYTDRTAEYQPGAAAAQSLANAVGNNNRRRSIVIEYPGILNITIASAVAGRELNVLSQPLAKITLTLTRAAINLRPGDAFKVTWPEYNLNGMIFRAQNVDLGQLFDNKVTVRAVQDAFASTYQGIGTGWNFTPFPTPFPLALIDQYVTESPRWLAMHAFMSGLVADMDIAHFVPLPISNFAYNATQYLLRDSMLTSVSSDGVLNADALTDVPLLQFPPTFTVATDYARELEPYDTTTGLVIQNVVFPIGWLGLGPANTTDIQYGGKHLIIIQTPSGREEIISFETSTFLGGGQYRLNNVWRGLLDTSPLLLSAGSRGWFLDANMIGRRGWPKNRQVQMQFVPASPNVLGSGGDPVIVYTPLGAGLTLPSGYPSGRGLRPNQAANMGIAGEAVVGTLGLPSIAGRFKSLSYLDEGVDYYGTFRSRVNIAILRGDAAADGTQSINTLIAPWAVKNGKAFDSSTITGSPAANTTDSLWTYTDDVATVAGAIQGCIKVDGFGMIDLILYTLDQINAGDPRIGKGGIAELDLLYNLNPPRVTAFAPAWRNLLANCRWDYQVTGPPLEAQSWNGVVTGVTGTTAITSGTGSLSRIATGKGSYFLTAASASYSRGQGASVRRWQPRGLTAWAVGYFKNTNGDANDTGQLFVESHSGISGGGPLLTSANTAATAFSGTVWTRVAISLVLPANTTNAVIRAAMAEVAGGGTANADVGFTEPELRVGQFQANVLANYSFETGPGIGSWTLDSGAITAAALIASPSANYAICSGAANAQMHQDYTLPAGWEYGCTAFVTCFRASRVGGANRGTVTVQALDVSNAVLASGTTGAETMSTIDNWYKRTVYCDTPAGTVTIRVIFSGTYSAGANVGECVDEVALWVGKDAAPRYVRTLDFSTPPVQATPTTWQEWVLAYPSTLTTYNPPPTIVLGGSDFGSIDMTWTDGVQHAVGKLCGQFGNGVTSINAYNFTRANGAGATHVAAIHMARSTVANFKLTDPFSVMVDFRVDEASFATACGLVGRMDLTAGWGINVSAGGQLTALLRGSGATSKSVSTGRVCTEGGYRKAVLVNDPVAQLLWIYDETGGVSVSTASGLNAIDRVADTCHLRVGRDADDHDVLPGQIARVYVWNVALTAAQVSMQMTYGKDATGLITTYTRSAASIVQMKDDAAGATLCTMPTSQVALTYHATLVVDGGSGYGVVVGKQTANKMPSWDFTDAAKWTPAGGVSVTQGIVDPTGLPRGATFSGSSPNGVTAFGVTLGASASTIGLSFYARINFGGNSTLKINLRNSSGTLVASTTVTLTALWKRFDWVGVAWNGTTATAEIEFVSNAGALTFDLAHVVHCWIQDGTNGSIPAMFPAVAGGSLTATTFLRTETLSVQFNGEGEQVMVGAGMTDIPLAGSLMNVRNGSNNKNRRELQYTGTAFRQAHYDGAASPAVVNSDINYSDVQDLVWTLRSRWQRIGLTDVTAGRFAQSALEDSGGSLLEGTAGRTVTWTHDTTQSTTIEVGTGLAGATDDLVLRSVTVQARESKLD